jgi:hypothetical protein
MISASLRAEIVRLHGLRLTWREIAQMTGVAPATLQVICGYPPRGAPLWPPRGRP